MDRNQRERQHQAALERINQVRLVTGRGDRIRIDHEGTILERARMIDEEFASYQATERGLAAFERLLARGEDRRCRHQRDVLTFIAALLGDEALPLVTLRGLETAIADDMVAVLDAYRYGRLQLPDHVEGGPARVARVLRKPSLAGA
ncbi:MAG TPA: hypothetical protein VEA40_17060 [Ramlibacter sp.]|nr:hypothetical protein [Ramlibacter sp.]